MLNKMTELNQFQPSHAGDISPTQAWEMLKGDPKAVMVDVRSAPEWAFVGTPDLSSLKKTLFKIAWRIYPAMQANPDFIHQVERVVSDKTSPLLFLCRTGGRSHEAAVAMSKAGYTQCYNILDGFEGISDTAGHRGNLSGWKAENLPWEQN